MRKILKFQKPKTKGAYFDILDVLSGSVKTTNIVVGFVKNEGWPNLRGVGDGWRHFFSRWKLFHPLFSLRNISLKDRTTSSIGIATRDFF